MSKFLLSILLSVVMNNVGISQGLQLDSNAHLKMAIYPSGTYQETYYFEIDDIGMMTVEKGTRISDDLSAEQYLKSIKYFGENELTTKDILEISKLTDLIAENNLNDDYMIKDGWMIQIYFKDETIEETYKSQVYASEDIRNSIYNFMEISPIDINLHGWS